VAALTLTIEHEELLGLSALASLEKTADTPAVTSADAAVSPDAAAMAQTLLRKALADRLNAAGLPWAPSAEAIAAGTAGAYEPGRERQEAARTASPGTAGSERPGMARKFVAYVLAIATVVVIIGGYGAKWQWTGFQANGQLWDWLSLLLLPVVVGVIPLWIKYRQHIDRIRRISHGAALAVWIALVVVGYVIPLAWTGFTDQTLWNWLSLLLVPVVVAVTATVASMKMPLPALVRSLRPRYQLLIGTLAAGFVVTVVGGYGLGWTWTGYQGNTLWDWLSLLLLPLVVPTALLPGMLRWIAGEEAWEASQSQQATASTRAAAADARPESTNEPAAVSDARAEPATDGALPAPAPADG
jgi:putative effector of murein hydrolase LrgA (UPF0299 family)